jgi:hypothetical protein
MVKYISFSEITTQARNDTSGLLHSFREIAHLALHGTFFSNKLKYSTVEH